MGAVAKRMVSAYDVLGADYDAWCRSVTEDVGFYVGLAVAAGRVLEVGVGSGRIAVPTAVAGAEVVGVDSSPVMLGLARRAAAAAGVTLDLHRADMRRLPPLGRFPVVTVPFRALLHLAGDRERLEVLRGLRRVLEPDGTLAFDVFHPDRQDISETHGRWIEREPEIYERALWDEPGRTVELAVRTAAGTATMRLWWVEPEAWRGLLQLAGFQRIERYGWFDRRRPRPDDADSVWIAQAGSDPLR